MNYLHCATAINNECFVTPIINAFIAAENYNSHCKHSFVDRTKCHDLSDFTKQVCIPPSDSSIIH